MNYNKITLAVIFLLAGSQAVFSQVKKQDSTKTKEKNIEGVQLKGSIKKNTEGNIISLQKKSVEVIERVGAVQLEKQGVSDVAVAVTKATGTQKQEGSGQVFVRGLGDRNNSTTLNGLPIPSNDPLFKNLDLSMIKTDMIESVSLEKVYNPKIWGDMSGANIDITSKAHSGKAYFKINLGGGINSNVIKEKDFFLQDGPNYFGTKQILKPKNATISQYGYAFNTSWKNKPIINPNNSSLGIDFGKSFNIGKEGKLSLFGYGAFENDYNFFSGVRRSLDNIGNPLRDLNLDEYKYATNTTGLFNINYKINNNHTVKFNTNFIHTTEQKLELYEGYIRDTNEDRANQTAYLRRANYKTNNLWINQLTGEHKVSSPLKIVWNLGYSKLDSRRPDRQQNISVYDKTLPNYYSYYFIAGNAGANHRYFDKLIENMYVGDVHADYEFSENAKITLGYQGSYRNSDFRAYQYNLKVNLASGLYSVTPDTYDSFFNYDNYQFNNNSGYFFDIRTFRGIVGSDPNALVPQYYNSKQTNQSAYTNLDYKISEKLTAQIGVRFDMLKQNLTYDTSILSGKINRDYNKILPALNVKYSINDTQNLRFSASKTYTTPLLLEIAPFEYEEVDEISYGNINIKPADNYNADLKWEWFFKRNELFSITAFGKYILDPLARTTVNSSSNSVSFVNVAKNGNVYGVEMELRKDLLNAGNSRFYTFLNATYLKTHHNLDQDYVNSNNKNAQVNFTKTESEMQGASNILANVNLGYEYKWSKNTLDFVLAYSHIGDNIYALGYQQKGDLVDKAINILDANLRIKLKNGLGISANVKNLLNPNFRRVQDNANGEVIVRDYKKGNGFGLGFSYEF